MINGLYLLLILGLIILYIKGKRNGRIAYEEKIEERNRPYKESIKGLLYDEIERKRREEDERSSQSNK